MKAVMFDDTAFSLFAPRESLKFDTEPSIEKPVAGRVKIVVVEQLGDLCLVNLPRPTFENGRAITVRMEQIH